MTLLLFLLVGSSIVFSNAANPLGNPKPFVPPNSDEIVSDTENRNRQISNDAGIWNNYEQKENIQQEATQIRNPPQILPIRNPGTVEPRYGGVSATSDTFQQRQNSEQEIDSSVNRNIRYPGTNYGWTGTNTGTGYNNGGGGTIICTVCSNYDTVNAQRCCAFGYRQCCNVGVYPTTYNSWSWARPIGGSGYSYNSGQDKPGTCYYSNSGYNSGGTNFNQNSGYYSTRRSTDDNIIDYGEIDSRGLVKREAPLLGSGYNNQQYGVPYNTGGYSGSRYPSSGTGNSGIGNSGGGYSLGSGYSGGGGYSSSGSGYSGGGGYYSNSGGHHGGNGIPPSSTYRPIQPAYCRKDYDCTGILKCCGGVCSNPVVTIG